MTKLLIHDSPLEHVGPVKFVWEQSQMNLFHPEIHWPWWWQGGHWSPVEQGWSHWSPWYWHPDTTEPRSWLLARSPSCTLTPLITRSLTHPTYPGVTSCDHSWGGWADSKRGTPPRYSGSDSSISAASPGAKESNHLTEVCCCNLSYCCESVLDLSAHYWNMVLVGLTMI